MPNIIINNYCNQKCSYCFAEDSMTILKNSSNTMSFSIFLSILKFLKSYNYKQVRFLGGEPLLHPEFHTFISLCQKGGFDCLLFSNLNLPHNFIISLFNKIKLPIKINCNLNNKDFYTDDEYKNIQKNIEFIASKNHEIIIGYNIYTFDKWFDDIADFAKKTWLKRINLKVTNTIAGKKLIIDTGSRAYWQYIYQSISKYSGDFFFEISCWLSKDIFFPEEIDFMKNLGIELKFWCSGFVGEFDIDIDGSIYKCFPTRQFYLSKWISIRNFNPQKMKIESFWILRSEDICSAHKI